MDGLSDNKKGVTRIFTTNEIISDIDSAFLRPGRIDKVLTFLPPSSKLREKFIKNYWDKQIIESINVECLVYLSEGCSFAELEEIKMLLVQRFIFENTWDLDLAIHDFRNRKSDNSSAMGFGLKNSKIIRKNNINK